MIVQQIGKRGFMLVFDDEISLYMIHCSQFNLLCDTHLGPESMDEIFAFLVDQSWSDRIVIFNSHSDWDHIWGNCAFPDSLIIGHEFCRNRMLERGTFDIRQNSSLRRGKVVITPPNLTFSDRLTFADEGIEFLYAPGHTIDSALCYDHLDQVLYIGDLVENPIPYLDAKDLDTYLTTLMGLMTHPAQILISAHSGLVNRDLIEQNMKYITDVRGGTALDPREFGAYRPVHQWNMNMRLIWEFDRIARERHGGTFSLVHLLEFVGDLHEISHEELKRAIDEYNRISLNLLNRII